MRADSVFLKALADLRLAPNPPPDQLWITIGRTFKPPASCTTISVATKGAYLQCLAPLDEVSLGGGSCCQAANWAPVMSGWGGQ
jgi:hypothetical protein